MLAISFSTYPADPIDRLRIRMDMTSDTMAMLIDCPRRRILFMIDDATPYRLRSTEPMIALVFGDENNAKPMPIKAMLRTISSIGVCVSRKMNNARPIAEMPMPVEARTAGCIRSDNVPVIEIGRASCRERV